MESGVYKITNPENQKSYIGSSYNVYYRWKKHLERLSKNKHPNIHLQRAFNKKISDFVFEILELCSLESLIEREQFYINTLNPEYNICKEVCSTSLGIKRREETKEKLRIHNTGKKQSLETIQKRIDKIKGLKRTDEQKQKLSESKKGNKNPIFKTGWDKQVEAMKKANLGSKRDISFGKKIAEKLSKPVLQYDLNMNFIKEWQSANEIERNLGFSNNLINRVCSGKKNKQGQFNRTAYKFIWKFKNIEK